MGKEIDYLIIGAHLNPLQLFWHEMQEDVSRIVKELNLLLESQPLIIVEGKKDKQALLRLGFLRIMIISVHLDKMSDQVVQELVGKKGKQKFCVILTDLDPAGRRLYARLFRDLSSRGVRVDERLRRSLLVHSRLRNIEGIGTYLCKWSEWSVSQII